ncbi:MAG TPA: hypothetical protein VH682_29855 [Gemmataceae bacterium]|jgi:hypothetical protein
MSMPSPSPSAPAKTELETVVNWPMLVTAAGLGFLLLAVPAVLACVAALKGDAVKDQTARPALEPVNVAPVAAPARPIASYEPKEVTTPLPVYREAARPPIKLDSAPAPDPAPAPIPVPAPIVAAPPPALDSVPQVPEVVAPPPFKRLDTLPEDPLREMLSKHAKEVDLESVKGTRKKLLAKAREGKTDKKSPSPILALGAEHPDLKGLPMIGEKDCQAAPETAKKMQMISQEFRRLISRRSGLQSMDHHDAQGLESFLAKRGEWFQDDGLSTVVQMLQAEGSLSRHALVKQLTTAKSARASTFLARAALFDLAADVREQAVKGLKDRPREEYRQVLLDGFRYPWPPVAAHAAEALVALDDQAAAFQLADLLDAPEPGEPVLNSDKKWVVREVVRVNHLRNCLLCHAPSTAPRDPVRGVVPIPGEPLPRAYYSSGKGDFVRADVTYLRQDFSVTERVAKPDKWPQWQRFDYLVRTRELTADELSAHRKKPPKSLFASYPQRNVVLFALRELTGLDVGEESADWQEVLWMSVGP